MTEIRRQSPFTFESVEYTDPRAVALREVMDAEMAERYQAADLLEMDPIIAKALYVDAASITSTILVLDADGTPIGHAALRLHDGDWEVKRVIIDSGQRQRGIGRAMLLELIRIATAGGAQRLILQTGNKQPESVALYTSLGFEPIPPYEPYRTAIPLSLCFAKSLV
jgi:ribosomal protein S18 acetylase RimI-like enzyme